MAGRSLAVAHETSMPARRHRLEPVPAVLAVVGGIILAISTSTGPSLLGLGIMAAGLAWRPGFGLSLLAVSLPFFLFPKKLGGMAFSMPELILLATVVGTALYALRRWWSGGQTGIATLATPFDRPIALFLAAALLSLLASEVLRVSLRDLRTLVLEPILAFYLGAWFLRSRHERALLLTALLLGAVAAAALGLYQYLFTEHVVEVEGAKRILGPYLSPNHMGLYLGRAIPIAVALSLFAPRTRPLAIPLLILLTTALFLTFSVGAWMATLLAVGTVTLLWNGRAALALTASALMVAAAALPILSLERVSSHFSLSRGTSFIRIQLWQSSLEMIRDHPLLGVGMDNFLYHYNSSYLQDAAAAEPSLSHPHNILLNFWLQMGALGVLAIGWLLAALGRCWASLWRLPQPSLERAILAGIAGATVDLVVHGMVDNSYFLVDLAFHFWLLAVMLVTIRRSPSPTLSHEAQME